MIYGRTTADEVFPFERLSDWASFANQLSVVTVLNERDGPPSGMSGDYTGCSVTLRIEETLWVAEGARTATGYVHTQVWCASIGGSDRALLGRGGPPLRAGQRFLVALVAYDHGYWGPMTEASVLPLDGDRVPPGFMTVHPIISQLAGLRAEEIAARLAATPADPIAERLRHLEPVERARRVLEIRYEAINSERPWVLPTPVAPTATAIEIPEIEVTYVPGGQRKPPGPPGFNGDEEFGPGGQQPFVDSSPILWLPPPDTLDSMVAEADVIVIGTVTGFLREAMEGSYAPDGTLQSPREAAMTDQGGELFPHPGVPSSYFEVELERVLLHDGRLEAGGTFELRLFGLVSDPAAQPWPLPEAGQRLLFVLGVNPDFRSYSTGPWGQIGIAGSQPVYQDWERTPIAFATDMTPAQFLAAVVAEIERQQDR